MEPGDQRALRAVAAQFFVNGAVFASYVPRLPELRDQTGVGVDTIGLLLSTAALAGLMASATVSTAIVRLGTRRVVVGGGLVLAASLALIGQARGPLVLLVGLVCVSLADVHVDVGMNLQATWLSRRRPVPVMNRLHGIWSVGTVAGGLASSLLAGRVSLGAHLLGVAAVLMVLVWVGSRHLLVDDEATDGRAVGAGTRRGGWWGLVVLFGLGLVALVMESVPYDWAAFRVGDDLGGSPTVAGLGFVAVTVGMTAGRLGGDHVLAWIGPARLRLLAVGLVAVGLVAATTVAHVGVALVGLGLVGLGNATVLPVLYERAARWPGRSGAGLGALTAGLRVATLLAPATVGALAATPLGVGSAILLVVGPCVVAYVLLVRTLR